ncbi:ASCH domain-containing protein [Streptomyces sp. SID2119]|uniref:ASCH domain-containing protein n=1 Tax=Streptomyces sp. SID2119 TaxID=2690253 RepID=UPI00136AAD01|nr:ASCH domain-containing protein [Streptomyces sp. SID2119]MYW29761.1 ASCH domain-containing protein [Streptomyces sp. SID2119]
MRALTIRQPWASAIAHGSKRTENRSWPAPAKHLGTRILIHAAASEDRTPRPSRDVPLELTRDMDIWPDTRSAIVAVATLAGCHFDNRCCTPWGMSDYYHWELADVAALPEPVPAKGALGFWTPPADVVNAVCVQQTGVAW